MCCCLQKRSNHKYESANEEDNNTPPLMVEAVRGGADMVVENAAELMDEIGLGDHKEEVPDDNESESDDDEDYYELDEDIMRRLKDNDPDVHNIEVHFSPDDEDVFDATTLDWEKDGVAIAENTHLKKLYTDDGWHHEDESQLANAKAFCIALSKNRSIKHFSMGGWPLGVEDTCSILSPFFEHNINLRSFGLHSCQWCIALGNLLQNPESKLEKLTLNYANDLEIANSSYRLQA